MKRLRVLAAILAVTVAPAVACDHPGPVYTQTDAFGGRICSGFPDDAANVDAFVNAPDFHGTVAAETKRPSEGDGGYELYVAYDRVHHLQYIRRLDIQPIAERSTQSMTYALIVAPKAPARVSLFTDLSGLHTTVGMHLGDRARGTASRCSGEAIYRFPGTGFRGDKEHGMDLWLEHGVIRGIRFWGEAA